MIRAYYYDANGDKDVSPDLYDKYKQFFDSLDDKPNIEVKLGQLILYPKGDRQKGVDILIAIDMLTKARAHS